jgi:hypothetical protein
MAFDYVSNQNNRNLQEGIGFKSDRKLKSKNSKNSGISNRSPKGSSGFS